MEEVAEEVMPQVIFTKEKVYRMISVSIVWEMVIMGIIAAVCIAIFIVSSKLFEKVWSWEPISEVVSLITSSAHRICFLGSLRLIIFMIAISIYTIVTFISFKNDAGMLGVFESVLHGTSLWSVVDLTNNTHDLFSYRTLLCMAMTMLLTEVFIKLCTSCGTFLRLLYSMIFMLFCIVITGPVEGIMDKVIEMDLLNKTVILIPDTFRQNSFMDSLFDLLAPIIWVVNAIIKVFLYILFIFIVVVSVLSLVQTLSLAIATLAIVVCPLAEYSELNPGGILAGDNLGYVVIIAFIIMDIVIFCKDIILSDKD